MRKPCCDKHDMNRGAWSNQEDQRLIEYIRAHGEGGWRSIPKAAGLLRCGKSCRLRWINCLRPGTKRRNFAEDEEDLIIKLHALLGNRWSLIAGRLPGRTDNEVKNHWNSCLRKLKSTGNDPNKHRMNLLPFHQPQSSETATLASNGMNLLEPSDCQRFSSENDQVSSAAIFLENQNSYRLPDLNLDLTIAIPTSLVEQRQESEDLRKSTEPGNTASTTTLLLFH